ncbi:unnamed protein product [Gongylonema pulchrum]|uniref:LITAF domain-containing protein n=1 Tax=Gongylonema pulchrum TaxID=637853 RepID=A0A183DXF4_9BILA|nr:unnamed protein product [Gongylonema pulchrum]
MFPKMMWAVTLCTVRSAAGEDQVCSDGILGRPPPDYSLTSPCLPPNSPIEQDWPPEPPPPFDGYPPYPAGPPLLKIAYPKDIPGPTYACPQCSGKFLASFLLFFCFHKANQKDPFVWKC